MRSINVRLLLLLLLLLGHYFQGQKVKGQLVADVLNSQHAGTGATWRINAKILSTCRGAEAYCVATRTACCGNELTVNIGQRFLSAQKHIVSQLSQPHALTN